jgi:serine phosphatase RsbU (regulator of sigma subunit)
MIATIRSCAGLSPAETIARLMQAADAFVAGAKQHDDMTLVVVQSKGENASL